MNCIYRTLFIFSLVLVKYNLYSCPKFNVDWNKDTLEFMIYNGYKDCINISDGTTTWLLDAMFCSNYNAVEYFVSNGANLKVRTNWGGSAFNQACLKDMRMLKIILSNGYKPSTKELNEGLWFALHSGQFDIAYFLVDSLGANINSVSSVDPIIAFSNTDSAMVKYIRMDLPSNAVFKYPIKDSLWYNIVTYLIEKGLEPNNARTQYQVKCYDVFHPDKSFSIRKENLYIYDTLTSSAFLLAIGESVPSLTYNGSIDPHFKYYYESIKKLIAHGADINYKREDGVTPLHLACHYSSLEVVELLLACGARIDEPDDNGWTPLLIAASRRNSEEIVRLLLKYGANRNKLNKYGFSALDIASSDEVKEMLSDE